VCPYSFAQVIALANFSDFIVQTDVGCSVFPVGFLAFFLPCDHLDITILLPLKLRLVVTCFQLPMRPSIGGFREFELSLFRSIPESLLVVSA
jgi:hypothetical protein